MPSASSRVPTRVEVLIVGAGPSGAAAAIELQRSGTAVTLVDKAVFPRDKCCGDGLTTGALRRLEHLGLDVAQVPSWQWVDDVHISSPKGYTVNFALPRGDGRFSAIATRNDLDHALLRVAEKAGARVVTGAAVTSASQHSDAVRVAIDGVGVVAAERVIAADGMWSPLRKMLGTSSARSEREPYLGEWHAYRQYFNNVHTVDSRDIWVWFEKDLLPGYAWSFPLADGGLNVGFGVERADGIKTNTMKALWASLLERPHIRAVIGADAQAVDSPKAWPIPAAITHAPLSDGRVLFVGDAARACDILTGEGIGQALQTGMMAAAAMLASPHDPRAAALRYENDVRTHLGPDHRMAVTLQRMMRSSAVCRSALRVCGATDWTRRNFARWLFEDYARGIALTPTRWRWGLMSGPGAYGPDTADTPMPTIGR